MSQAQQGFETFNHQFLVSAFRYIAFGEILDLDNTTAEDRIQWRKLATRHGDDKLLRKLNTYELLNLRSLAHNKAKNIADILTLQFYKIEDLCEDMRKKFGDFTTEFVRVRTGVLGITFLDKKGRKIVTFFIDADDYLKTQYGRCIHYQRIAALMK